MWGDVFTEVVWSKLKPWLYAGAVALAVGLLLGSYFKGRSDGIDREQPKIAALTSERDAALANVSALVEALEEQNQAVAELGRATKDAQAQIASLKARKPALNPVYVDLKSAKAGEEFCRPSDLNIKGWEVLK